MIALQLIKKLQYSAASGLARVGEKFITVSDDQLALEIFSLSSTESSTFLQLLPGELPSEPKQRKLQKPDLETLVYLQSPNLLSQPVLLAIPSGSTSHRVKGAWIQTTETLDLLENPVVIDLTELYQSLSAHFAELNIEGALVKGSHLKLFQRGNGASLQNAVIDLNLQRFLEDMEQSQRISQHCFENLHLIDLPKLNGENLGFTDAASDSSEPQSPIWFLAAAEKTTSTFEDGPFAGAVLGALNSAYEVIHLEPLDCSEKPEGLWMDSQEFFLVTDADDPRKSSSFFKGTRPDAAFE